MSAVLTAMPEGTDDEDDVFVIGCDSRVRALCEHSFFWGGKFTEELECSVAVVGSSLVRAARDDGLHRLAG